MASSTDPQKRANFLRISNLLVDKGTKALRMCFDAILPPANLRAVLNANKELLQALSPRQMDLLFPRRGNRPDSKTFDITLLSFLLRNICAALSSPALGWDTEPLATDCSREADIVRIELFRNKIYAHAVTPQIDNATFEEYWSKISDALYRLGIPAAEISYLKTCPLVHGDKTTKENHSLGRHTRDPNEETVSEDPYGVTEESGQSAESPESWAWEEKSKIHREKFLKLFEYERDRPQEIQEVNDVRFCCSKEFLIGRGSDGTKVFVGLSKDGYEKAVKRLENDDDGASLAEQEKKILTSIDSKHVVKYRFLEKSNKEWLFLIMDLCEETLEDYVKNSVVDGWSKKARDIIEQVLKGIADLHRDPIILHRDLKPRNILRDVDHNWLLVDFGISRNLPPGVNTLLSKERGTDYWKAVESCSNDTFNNGAVRYLTKSDIQVAGMVAFYTVTKGGHPFGEKRDQLGNILDGKPVGLVKVKDPAAKDLISWMLSHDPKDRPSAEEALKHPYFQPAEQQFKMLSEMGNQHEIKTWRANSDVKTELNKLPNVWQYQMDPDVLQYLCTNVVTGDTYRYGSSWSELLRLIRNVDQHWHDRPRPLPQPDKEFYIVDDPQEYFLNLFPNLPVEVHKIVRSCDWKERPKLKEYFIANIKDKS